MAEWIKVGASVIAGGAAGVVDQLVQNQDAKREAERGEKLPVMQQIGTYYNYGGAIVSILLAALGVVKGDWAVRAVTIGSQLAGRRGTWQATTRREAAWTPWRRDEAARKAEAARQRALAEARTAKQIGGVPTPVSIPIVSDETVLI